jgi:hypothetical protein
MISMQLFAGGGAHQEVLVKNIRKRVQSNAEVVHKAVWEEDQDIPRDSPDS